MNFRQRDLVYYLGDYMYFCLPLSLGSCWSSVFLYTSLKGSNEMDLFKMEVLRGVQHDRTNV